MNIKDFRKFLSINPDKDGNSSPVTLDYDLGLLHLTYKRSGMLIKIPTSLNGGEERWSIIVDHVVLMDAIASIKTKGEVTLSLVGDDLAIAVDEQKVTVHPWGKQVVDFDPDLLELDSQVIKIDGKRWADVVAASKVAKLNKKGVNPEIVGKGVHCHIWGEYLTVSAWSPTVSCCRSIALSGHPIEQERQLVLSLEAIDLVASMKPSEVTLTMDYEFKQLLIETDIGYILVDLLQEKYPSHDGIQKLTESVIQVKRKDLLDAVKAAVEANAKNITLVFDNDTVIVEAPKTKKQEISAESDSAKKFTATVKVAAGALLEALKAVSAAKILMYFPAAAANSLVIDTVTGVMYIFVVTVKVAAQIVESAADALKTGPQREVVATGTNSDGTPFVVESVEASPLEKELSPDEKEEKQAKLQEEYGEKAETAEAVLEVANLREEVRGIVAKIDKEISELRSQPESEQSTARIRELSILHRKLTGVVSETETVESVLSSDVYETQFTLEGLREVSLKLKWWGGRTLLFLWKEESQWLPEMRLSEPVLSR